MLRNLVLMIFFYFVIFRIYFNCLRKPIYKKYDESRENDKLA